MSHVTTLDQSERRSDGRSLTGGSRHPPKSSNFVSDGVRRSYAVTLVGGSDMRAKCGTTGLERTR